MVPLMRNALTDVPGLIVGHAQDRGVFSGVSVVVCERACVAAVDVRGGGTGTRETEALSLAGGPNAFGAVVEDINFLGAIVRLRLRAGGDVLSLDQFNQPAMMLPEKGASVSVSVAPEEVIVLA